MTAEECIQKLKEVNCACDNSRILDTYDKLCNLVMAFKPFFSWYPEFSKFYRSKQALEYIRGIDNFEVICKLVRNITDYDGLYYLKDYFTFENVNQVHLAELRNTLIRSVERNYCSNPIEEEKWVEEDDDFLSRETK